MMAPKVLFCALCNELWGITQGQRAISRWVRAVDLEQNLPVMLWTRTGHDPKMRANPSGRKIGLKPAKTGGCYGR